MGYNLIGGGNNASAFSAAGDQTGVTNPGLGALADNGGPTQTHVPLAGSPAIDAGDPAAVAGVGNVPQYDQRGAPFGRVVGVIDIGAVESIHNFVVDTAIDENDGDYSVGDLSLREALEAANVNPGADVIDFDPGLAGSSINLVLGQLTISDDVTINGLGADQLTIDAQGASRVMAVTTNATADVSGLTITGGNAAQGGGVYNAAGATTSLDAVVISGNSSTSNGQQSGGGVANRGNLTITDSTISANTSQGWGGGVSNTGTLTVDHSTVSSNLAPNAIGSAGVAAGINNNGGVLVVVSSTISGNTAAFAAGGLLNYHGTTDIRHSTIASNNGGSYGGGLFMYGGTISNTIVANNTAAANGPDIAGTVTANWSLIEDTSGATISGANNVTGLDPMLGPLQDNGGPTETQALLPGSPAIDAGDPMAVAGVGTVPLYDQRGTNYERVQAGRIDIGAYELLLADGNLDGQVDGLDYLLWASHYPDNPAADPPGSPQNGDYNNDGKVDGVDYLLWASQYLQGTPAVAASQPAASTQEQLAAVDTTFANAYSVGATVQDWQVSQAFDAVLKHDTVLKHKDKRGK